MNPENFIDTALNQIISDLWPIINEYYCTQPIFVVGKISGNYPGYRLITEDDLRNKIIINSLVSYYKRNKGISSLDDFCGVYICGNDIDISIYGQCLRYEYSYLNEPKCIKKFDIIRFKTGEYGGNEIIQFLNAITPSPYQASMDNTGLFVINNIIPDRKKNDKK